jgi:hypothetical protein
MDFQVIARWRPGGFTLADAADRMARTLRSVSAVWPEIEAWQMTTSAASAVTVDDPELPQRILPRLKAGRDRRYRDSDSLGDADASFYPAPYTKVSVQLMHNNPTPTSGQVMVDVEDAPAARLTEDPPAIAELLRTLAETWAATMGFVGLAVLRQYQPYGYSWRPYFGWATWLAKDLAAVDPAVPAAKVTEHAGGQLIVLRDPPDAIRRESIEELVAHTRMAGGTPLADLPVGHRG